MKKMYKAMLLVLCAILLVAGSVMGTLAYLQMTTKTVTNVMTVGNVSITLTETELDADGNVTGTIVATADSVTGGPNTYKLIPNQSYVKDPTVTVAANSEACYVFVKVVNGIKNIEDADSTIAAQMVTNGWTVLNGDVYYKAIASSTSDTECPVFASFKISSAVTNATLATYQNATITVQAFAIQSYGFNTAAEAWAAGAFVTNP